MIRRMVRTLRSGRPLPAALLAAATVLLLVAPVLGLGLSARATIASDVAARIAQDRVDSADLAARLLADDLHDAGRAIASLALDPEVARALRTNDRAALAAEIARFRAAWPGFMSVLALDARGTELVIGATNASGSLPPVLAGSAGAADRSTRDYFIGPLSTAGPFVSEAYRSGAPGNPALVAVSIAVREGSDLRGVMVGTLQPQDLIEPLAIADQADGRELVVVDKRSHVVASTEAARVPLSDAGLPELVAALEGKSGSVAQMLGSGERVVTYVPVRGASWTLYVIDDPSVVLALERGVESQIGLATAIATAFAAVAGAVLVGLFAALSRRSSELADSRSALESANAELLLANKHKSEFLASVSHELRTPLNAIIGFTDLLDEQLAPAVTERQRRYFRNVRESGEHLLDLISDVLDLSRVDSGRIDLRPVPITLEQLFEPVIANARRAATEHGLGFESDVAPATVRVDPGRVRQVLYNLTSNAAKFTPRGSIRCSAWIFGDALVFEVGDTGIGIPADRRPRVFGMFERVNEDRSEARGTGLGLALSKRLVEAQGGTIDFASRVDAGTTFRVRIPGVGVPETAPAPDGDTITEVPA